MEAQTEPQLGFLVADVARMLREHFNNTAKAVGLTLAQARVLLRLSRNEGTSQVALAALLEIQPITLLRQIDRLAELKLLERRPNPTDRRAQQLYLTTLARPLVERIWQLSESLKDTALVNVDEAAREQLMLTLQQIKSNLAIAGVAATQDHKTDATTRLDSTAREN